MFLHVNDKLINDLKIAALDAFKSKHYLQSAVIIFQTVEFLLRIRVSSIARSKGIDEKVRKRISEEETSVYQLVCYLNLLDPDSILLQRLYKFNTKRNDIIHNLFIKFEDVTQYDETIKEFCMEGISLNEGLRSSMGID